MNRIPNLKYPDGREMLGRTDTVGVNVVHNDRGWHINIFLNGTPSESVQVEGFITIADALLYVGARMKLEQ